jgi:hypothetical protein
MNDCLRSLLPARVEAYLGHHSLHFYDLVCSRPHRGRLLNCASIIISYSLKCDQSLRRNSGGVIETSGYERPRIVRER